MIMSLEYPCVYQYKGKCKKFSGGNITSWCVWGPCDDQTPSNADKIREMTDEQLARWLEYEGGGACAEVCGWLDWLKLPAEEDDNGKEK